MCVCRAPFHSQFLDLLHCGYRMHSVCYLFLRICQGFFIIYVYVVRLTNYIFQMFTFGFWMFNRYETGVLKMSYMIMDVLFPLGILLILFFNLKECCLVLPTTNWHLPRVLATIRLHEGHIMCCCCKGSSATHEELRVEQK